MSTLSSSVNSLASSSILDIYQRFRKGPLDDRRAMLFSRLATLFWGAVLISFASLFEDTDNPVVELGLTIASFTYGGLLGVFLLGMIDKRSGQADALIAFTVTILTMIWIIFGIWYSMGEGWVFEFLPSDLEISRRGLVSIAWPWYPVIGSAVTLSVGALVARLRNRRGAQSQRRFE